MDYNFFIDGKSFSTLNISIFFHILDEILFKDFFLVEY